MKARKAATEEERPQPTLLDELYGGSGNDYIDSDGGHDTVVGGEGNDDADGAIRKIRGELRARMRNRAAG